LESFRAEQWSKECSFDDTTMASRRLDLRDTIAADV
jgi:hypothetical protein